MSELIEWVYDWKQNKTKQNTVMSPVSYIKEHLSVDATGWRIEWSVKSDDYLWK